jgi:dTMP kinase
MNGKFITFEGGEGGGKSTQSKLLADALTNQNISCIQTREPGGTEGAEAIRNLLVTGDTNRWDSMTELLLHLAARRDHVEKKIRPALAEGKWIICDRFMDSTFAYQGYGHGSGAVFVETMHRLAIGTLMPDLTFILDIPPTAGIARTDARKGNENRYERMASSFHERVRMGFLAVAAKYPERCVVIDASQSIEHIHHMIKAALHERLGILL